MMPCFVWSATIAVCGVEWVTVINSAVMSFVIFMDDPVFTVFIRFLNGIFSSLMIARSTAAVKGVQMIGAL